MSTARSVPSSTARPALRAVDSDDDLPASGPPEPGWRAGRPLEDPEKTKRWGFVTAKPSEYLIHMRRGQIRRRGTGQGASCFKWPWDSVAIIPTTINRLQFAAEQVTLEKVGMRVTGLAVYRIVEPEIAVRMLNFSYAERASEKLAEILREMFVGATRRHVANLGVEAVMTRRKDAIAEELLAELAPVLAGHGRTDDTTSMGWGVVLDTVEIQDVRVLSEEVFANMQASFRAEIDAKAREAEGRAEHARIVRERGEQIAQLQAQAEVEAERARQEEHARKAALERELRILEAERELVDQRHEAKRREAEREAERRRAAAESEAALKDAHAQVQARLHAVQLETQRAAGELETAQARERKAIEDSISDARIRMELVARTMPAMAQAFAQQIGELKITQIGSGDDVTGMVARGLAQVVEVARGLGLGLEPPRDPSR